MCGIVGIANRDVKRCPDPGLLACMCESLVHRGPDDSGGMIDDGIGLAMRRLAVIDRDGGHQPIFNETRSVCVVFNGEIYNFPELQASLVDRGHRLSTKCDTETIVHLYEEYGLEFVQRVQGMFAIAIWDFDQQRLLLVRDRIGVKPLYYAVAADHLCFASEVKALLQNPDVPKTPDPAGLHQLLTLGHVLPPTTCFQGIQELPPASILSYQAGRITVQRYWDLDFAHDNQLDEVNSRGELLQRARDAVACRLISEVPLGAFLSGGIDSGLVVALMSKLLAEPVKTFSIGFDDPSFSELPYARLVAEKYRTDHHEFIVKPNVPDIIDELISHHDAPFYDSSAIPTYYVSQFAREHVTVALSGDGGDEMFAGYDIYLANEFARHYCRIPKLIRNAVEPVLSWVPESKGYVNRGRVVREFVRGASLEPLSRYTRWATKIKREARERLYLSTELRSQLREPDEFFLTPYFEAPQNTTELNRLLYIGTNTDLPCDMLVKVDRMSMAHSLEVRSPFLDYRLFEFAAGLPDRAKLRGRTTKVMLRQLARQLLPRSTWNRPKRGFSIPLDRWLREDLKVFTEDILFDPRTEARGMFDNRAVREFVAQHCQGAVSRSRELWTLLTIELWQRLYIDSRSYLVQDAPPLKLKARFPTTQEV